MSGKQSARWNSTMGFGLAVLGSAIGLGNIWRFPYVMGEYGGAAFLLVYLLVVLIMGLPLLLGEFAAGYHTHADGVGAYEKITPERPWRWAGWPGVAAAVVILMYYPVVTAWVAQYLWLALTGDMSVPAGAAQDARFVALTHDGLAVLLAQAIVLCVATGIVAAGVVSGIERTCKVLMPLFAVLLVGLAIYGLSLPGAQQGVDFMFHADWSAVLRPETWLVALGQALFTVGIGMGVMVTYGAYLPDSHALPRIGFTVIAGDTFVGLLACLIIFPAVFSLGLAPAQGPGLAFVILPEVFERMPGGNVAAVAFFLLLLIAALASMVSLLEVPIAVLMSRHGWRRLPAALLTGSVAFLISLPVALGEGTAWLQLDGMPTLLDLADRFASYVLLPLSALAIALVVGWRWQEKAACDAAGVQGIRARRLWWTSVRWLVPVLLVIVLVSGLVTA
ncbi:MAG: sodium-dependent transporter [Moraxellaceae bacterium]|nr:sodium-dependent transporter [Moraxellaceae bacterium]